jgi:hypothetical protein
MTSQALQIANQITNLSDSEVDYLWDFLRRRRNESLLKLIDIKLEESMVSDTLNDEKVAERLNRLGIA